MAANGSPCQCTSGLSTANRALGLLAVQPEGAVVVGAEAGRLGVVDQRQREGPRGAIDLRADRGLGHVERHDHPARPAGAERGQARQQLAHLVAVPVADDRDGDVHARPGQVRLRQRHAGVGQQRLVDAVRRQRPVDADGGVVPEDAALVLRRVVVVSCRSRRCRSAPRSRAPGREAQSWRWLSAVSSTPTQRPKLGEPRRMSTATSNTAPCVTRTSCPAAAGAGSAARLAAAAVVVLHEIHVQPGGLLKARRL